MYRLFLFLCTVYMLTSCGYHRDLSDNQRVFHMNIPAGLSSLDPAFARDQANAWMVNQLFDGLVSLDSGLRVIPAIAHSWEISDSGTVYTFFLRRDVYFHKHPGFGTDSTRRVQAQDFVFSFSRICEPATASFGQWIFNDKVLGTPAMHADIPGFMALNDSTFRVTLKQAFPPFISLLAMPYAKVVPREVINIPGYNFRENPIGTGPFCFKSWQEGQSLIFLRNPLYYEMEGGERLPYLSAVRVKFASSPVTTFHQLIKGDLDFINRPDLSLKDELFDENGRLKEQWFSHFYLIEGPQLNTEYLGILMDTNQMNHPLKDVKLRQAINYALNRDQLVKYVLKGMGYPAHAGIVPPGMPGNDTLGLQGYRYNPEKARALLKAAGYPEGKGLPPITLYTSPAYQSVMEFIQYQLLEVGIRLQLENMEGSAIRERIYQGDIAFWRASWIADYPDPENYLSLFYSPFEAPSGPNTTRYKNPELDVLFQKALSETDMEKRAQYYRVMQAMIIQDAPIVLLYYDKIIRLVRKEIEGLETDGMNNLVLKRVRKR